MGEWGIAPGSKHTAETFLGPRYYRLRTVRGLQERGLIDDQLRRV